MQKTEKYYENWLSMLSCTHCLFIIGESNCPKTETETEISTIFSIQLFCCYYYYCVVTYPKFVQSYCFLFLEQTENIRKSLLVYPKTVNSTNSNFFYQTMKHREKEREGERERERESDSIISLSYCPSKKKRQM